MSFIKKLGGLLFKNSAVKGVSNADQATSKLAADIYENGVIALANNHYEKALEFFKKASVLGHVSAKYNTGLMLYNGLGDYNNFELARKYFEEAKALGHDKCDNYINFLDLADQCMDISVSDADGDPKAVMALCSFAFKKMSISPDKQNGEFVYMAHHYLLRFINGREYLAHEFIENEIGTMFIEQNDDFTHFLKYRGIYDKGYSEADYLNTDSLVSNYLDEILFSRLISFSNYKLDYSDLSYSRCCIVNEIMKKFPSKRYGVEKFGNSIIPKTEAIVHGKQAYDMGMKYLNEYPINFDLARESFRKAVNLGYTEAREAAEVIGLDEPKEIDASNSLELMKKASANYKNNQNHIGDLVYLMVHDLKFNIFNTSSNPIYYASRFVDYEVFCMRRYGHSEVKNFHNKSSLKNWDLQYAGDWENGDVSSHSEYLNEKLFPIISVLSGISMMDMAVLRTAVVADIVDNYI